MNKERCGVCGSQVDISDMNETSENNHICDACFKLNSCHSCGLFKYEGYFVELPIGIQEAINIFNEALCPSCYEEILCNTIKEKSMLAFQKYTSHKRIPNLSFGKELFYTISKIEEEVHELTAHYIKNEFCKKPYNSKEIEIEAGDLLWGMVNLFNLINADINTEAINGQIDLTDYKNLNLNLVSTADQFMHETSDRRRLMKSAALIMNSSTDSSKVLELAKGINNEVILFGYTCLLFIKVFFDISGLDMSVVIRRAIDKNEKRHKNGFDFSHYTNMGE